jgi:cytoplasmic iron level regulating protein YaaA (DUF328/UPF0246 family)
MTLSKAFYRKSLYQKTRPTLSDDAELCAAAGDYRARMLAERQRHLDELNVNGPQHVVLIACSQQKTGKRSKASHLYVGDLFVKSRTYAEARGWDYFILSALHGFVRPDETIDPYNFTLRTMSKSYRENWAGRVMNDLVLNIPTGSTITMLAGNSYADPLQPKLKRVGYAVERPLRGLGIGQQKKWLKENSCAR